MLAELRRDVAYADLQNGFGKILVSMGLDPLPNGFGSMSIEELSTAFNTMFDRWEQGQVETVSEEQMQSAYMVQATAKQES